ncbi:MAG TPA: DUF2062 domain-containing protein [Alphaproteobacteria bacterium]|nr:DUF2062 domain-containing protein [Alphaproteobacteria bacterium]
MLFKRREKGNFIYNILYFLWPKKGWMRIIKYIALRLKRLPHSPHSIALGFTFGVAAAITPFFGLHFFIGIFLAWLFRASIFASIIGNLVGNPWTFPFIWIMNYKVGILFYSTSNVPNINMKLLSNELLLLWNGFYTFFIKFSYVDSLNNLKELQIIPPMIFGSFILIILIGMPCYFLSRLIIINYKNKIKLSKKKT